MRSVPPRDDAEAPTWRSIVEGFRYARSRQELIGTYVIDFVAMVFGMPLALFPALAATGSADAAPRPPVRGASRRGARRQPDVALDGARPSPGLRGDGSRDGLGRRHRRLRPLALAVAGAGVPGRRRRRRRGQRHVPDDAVEPDHPRCAARPSRRHRDGQLHERAAARPRRSGSRGGARRGAGARSCRAGCSASSASSPAASPCPSFGATMPGCTRRRRHADSKPPCASCATGSSARGITAQIFSRIYRENVWGDAESVSGPGSTAGPGRRVPRRSRRRAAAARGAQPPRRRLR